MPIKFLLCVYELVWDRAMPLYGKQTRLFFFLTRFGEFLGCARSSEPRYSGTERFCLSGNGHYSISDRLKVFYCFDGYLKEKVILNLKIIILV